MTQCSHNAVTVPVCRKCLDEMAHLLMEAPIYMAAHLTPVGEQAAARLCARIHLALEMAGYKRATATGSAADQPGAAHEG